LNYIDINITEKVTLSLITFYYFVVFFLSRFTFVWVNSNKLCWSNYFCSSQFYWMIKSIDYL